MSRSYGLAACGALVALVAACYASGIAAPFYYDDWPNIIDNYSVHWRELSLGQLWDSVAASPSRRPLAVWSFGLSHYLNGLDATAFRIVNVALHAANACLVTLLAAHALRSRGVGRGEADPRALGFGAFVAGACFAAHPLHTQSVTYVVQRMNVMAVFFYLCGMLAYLRARKSQGRRRTLWWMAVGASYLASVGSKPIGVTLPYAIWLYEWFFVHDLSRIWARRHFGWLLVPVAIGAAVVVLVLGGDLLHGYGARDFTPLERVLTQSRVLWLYLSLIVWPAPSRLTLLHDFEVSQGLLTPPTTLFAILGLVVLLCLACALARRQRFLAFAIAWFFLHSAIESSFLSLMMVFEHRTYLPLVGICIGVGALAAALFAKAPRRAVATALAVVAVLAVATGSRNHAWADGERFWRDAITKGSHPRLAANLGQILAYRGDDTAAIPYYLDALRRDPNETGALRGLATSYTFVGRGDEAAELWYRVLRTEPDDHRSHEGLGEWHLDAGRIDEAWAHNQSALAGYPTAQVAARQAQILRLRGRPDDALRYADLALELDPAHVAARSERALALAALGRGEAALREVAHATEAAGSSGATEQDARTTQRSMLFALAADAGHRGDPGLAVAAYRQWLAREPDDPHALNDLAWLLATSAEPAIRDPRQAEALALRAVEVRAGDASQLDTLAAAHAAAGHFDAAIEMAKRALALGPDARLGRAIEARLDGYRRGEPHFERGSGGAER